MGFGDPANGGRPSRLIDDYQSSLQYHSILRHFELLGHVGHETLDDRLDLPANDTVMWACEAGVAQECRATWEDLLIGSLHMGVGAQNCAHSSVEHSR